MCSEAWDILHNILDKIDLKISFEPQYVERLHVDECGRQRITITLREQFIDQQVTVIQPQPKNDNDKKDKHNNNRGTPTIGCLKSVKQARQERKLEKRKRKEHEHREQAILTSGEEKDDQKAKRKQPTPSSPTHFVAIQITDTLIINSIDGIQRHLLDSDSRLEPALVPIETLHLTMLVMNLQYEEDNVCRAREALVSSARAWREHRNSSGDSDPTSPLMLPLHGLDTFRNQVLFAKILGVEALEKLEQLAGIVEQHFTESGLYLPPSDSSKKQSFAPHITVAKLSRVKGARSGRKQREDKGLKQIPAEAYHRFKGSPLGCQAVTHLQLLEMRNRVKGRYYNCVHQERLYHGGTGGGMCYPQVACGATPRDIVSTLMQHMLTYVEHIGCVSVDQHTTDTATDSQPSVPHPHTNDRSDNKVWRRRKRKGRKGKQSVHRDFSDEEMDCDLRHLFMDDA